MILSIGKMWEIPQYFYITKDGQDDFINWRNGENPPTFLYHKGWARMILSVCEMGKIPDHFIEVEQEVDAILTAAYLAENLRDGLIVKIGFLGLESGKKISDEFWASLFIGIDGVKAATVAAIPEADEAEDRVECQIAECLEEHGTSNSATWRIKVFGDSPNDDYCIDACGECFNSFKRDAVIRYNGEDDE